MPFPRFVGPVLFVAASLSSTSAAFSQEAIVLVERFSSGLQYHVETRVTLKGQLRVPVAKDKPPQLMGMRGESKIDYDERNLPADGKTAEQKTIRLYRTIDFNRTIGDREQQIALRDKVRRLVVMKMNRVKVPFSPDGPLTWGEIDMLRTDIFVPALAGILPDHPVKPGESWKMSDSAVVELTDMEKIERGGITCKFDGETTRNGRKFADISLDGELSGVNEDGPNRQKLSGRLYFDLKTNHICYLSINGEHSLLDKEGKVNGKVSGQFVMARNLNPRNPDLTDAALAKVALEPSADNTLLLYEEPDLGLRLLHPRRWRIGRVQKGQITLDESNGSGLLITVEFPSRVPTAAAYQKEALGYLKDQKATIMRYSQPVRLANAPNELDQFSIETELGGEKVLMDYLIARQANAGATFAASIKSSDRNALIKEVEQIARSLTMTRKFENR
jgi:hypothetical protein